jgi:K+:H+ antiporter
LNTVATTVIGQILAGVLLGSNVLGRLPGHLTSHLFPHQVLPYLTTLAQVAVAIFMFSAAYEVHLAKIRGRGRAPLLAAGALAVPIGLGIAYVLLFRPAFAALGEVHQGRSSLLFMGVATSIAAMPVLTSIVRERGLTSDSGPFPLPVALALAVGSGWVTGSLRLQAVFGGFIAGLSMPLFVIVTGFSLYIGAIGAIGGSGLSGAGIRSAETFIKYMS